MSPMLERVTEAAHNVVITGASRGLGLGIARKLSAAGYRVIAVARSKSKQVAEAIAEAERSNQTPLHFAAFDLGNVEQISRVRQEVAQRIRSAVRIDKQRCGRSRRRAGDDAQCAD